MKKIIHILGVVLITSSILFSCQTEVGPYYDHELSVDPVLSPLASSEFVLSKSEAADVLVTVSWDRAQFGGVPSAVNYTLQLCLAGDNFNTPARVYTGSDAQYEIKVGEMNTLLKRLGAVENEAAAIELRVYANVVNEKGVSVGLIAHSNTLSLTVTPYSEITVYPILNIPGGYQGWDVANNNTVIYSVKDDGVYNGYLWINEESTELKFAKGTWDENWGAATVSRDVASKSVEGTLEAGASNIVVDFGIGIYKFRVDIENLTFDIQQTDWSIIGSSVDPDWSVDLEMEYDAELNLLRVTSDFEEGEFKFRSNKDWSFSLGSDEGVTDPENALTSKDGANIKLAQSGQYTIALKLMQAIPTYGIYKGSVIADWPFLNVPGGHQGWDPSSMSTVIWSAKSNDFYEGYMYMAADNEFKFAYTSWGSNWGVDGDDKVEGTRHSGSLKHDGGNLKSDGEGYYLLEVDLTELKYSYILTEWGIIGDATSGGWDSDTMLEYDPETGLLSVTTDLEGGKEWKFRANGAWDINYGDSSETGIVAAGGDNFTVEESGSYTITLDLRQKTSPGYKYSIVKN